MKKEDIENVSCPFCGNKIKGEIPEGLNIKKVIDVINRIDVALKEIEKFKTE